MKSLIGPQKKHRPPRTQPNPTAIYLFFVESGWTFNVFALELAWDWILILRKNAYLGLLLDGSKSSRFNIHLMSFFLQFSHQTRSLFELPQIGNTIVETPQTNNLNELFQGFFSLLAFRLQLLLIFWFRKVLFDRIKNYSRNLKFPTLTIAQKLLKIGWFSPQKTFFLLTKKFKALFCGCKRTFCTAQRFQIDCGIFSIRKCETQKKNVRKKLDCASLLLLLLFEPRFRFFLLF